MGATKLLFAYIHFFVNLNGFVCIEKTVLRHEITTSHYGKRFIFALTGEPTGYSSLANVTILTEKDTHITMTYAGTTNPTGDNGTRHTVDFTKGNFLKAGVIDSEAIEINTSKPAAVICSYAVKRSNGSVEYVGYIVRPTEMLGNTYVVASTNSDSFFAIIAHTDTDVSIVPGDKGSVEYKDVVYITETKLNISLKKYETIRFSNINPKDDYSGAKISADGPITVISGSSCYSDHCNYAVSCLLPEKRWGKKFIVRSRSYGVPTLDKIRIFTATDKNKVKFDEAEENLDDPTDYYEKDLQKNSVIFVTCTKRCQMMQYAEGPPGDVRGPSLMWIQPIQEFRTSYRLNVHDMPAYNIEVFARKPQRNTLSVCNCNVPKSGWSAIENTKHYERKVLQETCKTTTVSSESKSQGFGVNMFGWTLLDREDIHVYKSFGHMAHGLNDTTVDIIVTPDLSTAPPTPKTQDCTEVVCQLPKEKVNATNVDKVSQQLTDVLAGSANNQTSGDIANVADIIESIVKVEEPSKKVVDNVLTAINSVLDVNVEVLDEGQQETNTSSRILKSLEDILGKINVTEDNPFQKVFDNFAVDVSLTNTADYCGTTFGGTVTNGTLDTSSRTTTIQLPGTLFNETTTNTSSTIHTIIMTLFKETKFFKVNSSRERLNSYVIAGDVKGVEVGGLKNPVVLTFQQPQQDKESTRCVYWNPKTSRWSNEGCEFHKTLEDGRAVCHCNHLTNFAILLDIDVHDETTHKEVLGIISYVGCAISLVGLILTIATILMFRDLRSNAPTQILLNFCIALSLTLVVFLVGAERSRTPSHAFCRGVAIVMHYLVLATFMWMAIAAFNMYLAFVKVLNSYFPKFMLKCSVVAWGVPLLVVIVTMAVALDDYGDATYCRLLGLPFIVALLAPSLIILVGNTIAFVLIFHSLLKTGSKVTADLKITAYQQARQGVAIFVLLGLTWLFGILAISDAKMVFQYLFCIFNSLQGLFVFLLYCVLSPSTRDKYRRFISKKFTYSVPRLEKPRKTTTMTSLGKVTDTHTNGDIEMQGSNSNPYALPTEPRCA